MKTVECTKRFNDVSADALRFPGDKWEVSDDRATQLELGNYVKILTPSEVAKAEKKAADGKEEK